MSNELRPVNFDSILGQENVVDRLRISINSAKVRGEALSHCLLDGAPGLGKTTISTAIANELRVGIKIANGGNIRSVKNLMPYLMKMEENMVFFIDEIHRLPVAVEEFLYPCMEDFRMDVGSDNELSMELPKFTMIGATTEAGNLSRPFFDRFTFKYQLKLYGHDVLSKIVSASAGKLNMQIMPNAATNISMRSRGTPRIANSIVQWCRDYALDKGSQTLSNTIVDEACVLSGISKNGSTEQDRTYMKALKKFGRPEGLKTLVDLTNIDKDTIQYVIEPFLMRQGLIKRTPRGRVLS